MHTRVYLASPGAYCVVIFPATHTKPRVNHGIPNRLAEITVFESQAGASTPAGPCSHLLSICRLRHSHNSEPRGHQSPFHLHHIHHSCDWLIQPSPRMTGQSHLHSQSVAQDWSSTSLSSTSSKRWAKQRPQRCAESSTKHFTLHALEHPDLPASLSPTDLPT